jgi:hypothetical protein
VKDQSLPDYISAGFLLQFGDDALSMVGDTIEGSFAMLQARGLVHRRGEENTELSEVDRCHFEGIGCSNEGIF